MRNYVCYGDGATDDDGYDNDAICDDGDACDARGGNDGGGGNVEYWKMVGDVVDDGDCGVGDDGDMVMLVAVIVVKKMVKALGQGCADYV